MSGTTSTPEPYIRLWSKQNRGREHPWHTMCSYLGSFPPPMARYFISLLTSEGDIVLDPFSGRGTTHLEARVLRRIPFSSDLNPLAVALTRAKNMTASLEAVFARIDELEQQFDLALYLPEAHAQDANIQLIFHPYTLARLCFLRRTIIDTGSDVDDFLTGATLGIMHGSERKDGSSAYASISMPNTFSMAPNYVRRFVQEKQLQRVDRDVFRLLRDKIERLFRQGATPPTVSGRVVTADVKSLSKVQAFRPAIARSKLILTSPPYLDVVNYAKQNWIRAWFLGKDAEQVSQRLDDNLLLAPWMNFMGATLRELRHFLAPDGVIVLVIGDVVRSKFNVLSPARDLLRRVYHDHLFEYIGCISDYLDINGKTTRVWKETKGRATAVDRVVLLANTKPTFSDFLPSQQNLYTTEDTQQYLTPEMAEKHANEFASLNS